MNLVWSCFGWLWMSSRTNAWVVGSRLKKARSIILHVESKPSEPFKPRYDLGLGKNKPFVEAQEEAAAADDPTQVGQNWIAPLPVKKPSVPMASAQNANTTLLVSETRTTRRLLARDEDSQVLRAALWDEEHFSTGKHTDDLASASVRDKDITQQYLPSASPPLRPAAFYPDIDLSIPETVYSDDGRIDLVWDLLRWEAYDQAQREPLLVSFLHSTILNHATLESSLASLLANRLQSPAMMISTQLQSVILQALAQDPVFRRSLRADMMAVRDRDPACGQLPDVFLYFKGFHALQSYRVAHSLWKSEKQMLAQFLQSRVSQTFQIDIHPNATLGSGILMDHGTGVVIGSTVRASLRSKTSDIARKLLY